MSVMDMIILVVLGLMLITGFARGFIRTLFDLMSFFITLGLTYYLFPYVSSFIITQTGIYKNLSEHISSAFDFDRMLDGLTTREAQINAIENLELPENFKEMLIENNNPEMFQVLDVSSFSEYISGSLASVVINVIVFLVLFVTIFALLAVLVGMLDLLSKLPGLNMINKLSGGILGGVLGLAYVFIGLTVLSIIISMNGATELVAHINGSSVGRYLYLNNPIMDLLNNNIENNHFWRIITDAKNMLAK